MKKINVLLLILICVFTLCGCKKEKADIYVTIYPLKYMAEEIVQDKMTVQSIYPSGSDIHTYDPSDLKSLVDMAESKMVFYIGAGLEGFMEKAENSIFSNCNAEVVELSKYITLLEPGESEHTDEDDHNHSSTVDLHVWLDPLRMIKMGRAMLDTIVKIDKDNKEFYETNANKLFLDLTNLDNDYFSAMTNSNISKKVMLVDHDAYFYWQVRYGIERLTTRLNNDSCEATFDQLDENVKIAKTYNIKYFILTKNVSVCSNVNEYIKELDLNTEYIHVLTTLSKEDKKKNKNYISIMYENLDVLKEIMPRN